MERIRISRHGIITTRREHFNHKFKMRFVILVVLWVGYWRLYELLSSPRIHQAIITTLQDYSDYQGKKLVLYYDFFLNNFWVFIIPLLLIPAFVLLKKTNPTRELRVYDSGIGFYDSEAQQEQFIEYSLCYFSYNKGRTGFRIVSRCSTTIDSVEYQWSQFVWSDVLHTNLLRYGYWRE